MMVHVHENLGSVWVFHGGGARLSSAVFTSIEKAETWISKNTYSGMLTEYPLDIGIYDWAVQAEFYSPKKGEEKPKSFAQNFSSASQNHCHYENGQRL